MTSPLKHAINKYKKQKLIPIKDKREDFFINFVLKFTFEYKSIIHSLFLIVNNIYKKIYILVDK